MQTFRVFIAITALIIWISQSNVLFAQQTAPSIENAKKEGEVVWYGTLTGGSIVGRILKTFEDKYPSIKVKYLRLGGAGLIERIRSEARSGKYLWDVVTAEYIQFFELPKYVTLAKYAPLVKASVEVVTEFLLTDCHHPDPERYDRFKDELASIARTTGHLVKRMTSLPDMNLDEGAAATEDFVPRLGLRRNPGGAGREGAVTNGWGAGERRGTDT